MIKQITLSNFKCFQSQTFDLREFTMLAGLNGMGKSSLIQSLLLLRQSHQQGLIKAGGVSLNGDLVHLGTARDALYDGAAEEIISFGVAFKGDKRAEWNFSAEGSDDMLEQLTADVDPRVFSQNLFTSACHYLQAERIGPRTSFQVSDHQVRRHRQLGPKGEYAAHFLSVHGRDPIALKALAHTEAKSEALIDQVEAWTASVSPGARIHATALEQIDLVNLRYSFVTDRAVSNEFRATNVGFGLTYTLPILVAILTSERGGLLLLENPEAHLHPKGQVEIGRLLARAAQAGVQVIMEPHSDHILNGMRIAVHEGEASADKVRLFYFTRKAEGDVSRAEVIQVAVDGDGRLDQWPDGFFDQWDKALSALLWPKTAAE